MRQRWQWGGVPMAVAAAMFFSAPASAAEDLLQYNRGLQALNAGDADTAAQVFFELEQNATDPDVHAKAQFYLADSLFKKGLPISALIEFVTIMKDGSKHPFYLKAVEGMVDVQKTLGDEYVIPSILDQNYNDAWATLPPEVLARINYLIGLVDLRRAKFEEAKGFLEAPQPENEVYPKSQYLLGIALVDPRFPGGAKPDDAIKAFNNVVALPTGNPAQHPEREQARQLAMIALGRTYYGLGQYQVATSWYERVPRFSKFWDQALFENAWARFQSDDYGGALGSLQSLHAPQFAGAFQPESWTLKATVYYFSCMYEEAKAALKNFDELYLPMAEKLKGVVEGPEQDNDFYYRLVSSGDTDRIPRAVMVWVRNNERVLGVVRMLQQVDTEKAALMANQNWVAAKLSSSMVTYLDSNRATWTKVAGSNIKVLLSQAFKNIRSFSDNAEIIRFETTKGEKELIEAGVDQRALLGSKALYRPQMPAENWNYWKFEGEFWRDEIGYYQYTLKKGCPASKE